MHRARTAKCDDFLELNSYKYSIPDRQQCVHFRKSQKSGNQRLRRNMLWPFHLDILRRIYKKSIFIFWSVSPWFKFTGLYVVLDLKYIMIPTFLQLL